MTCMRRWFVGLLAVASLTLVPTSSASAADMTLTPDNITCDVTLYPDACVGQIGIVGTGFPANQAGIKFYWMDPPYLLLAAGFPGAIGQQVSGEACRTLGHPLLNDANPPTALTATADSGGGLVTSVQGPQTPPVYGGNAICAVWETSLGSPRGFGNQYTIYPV